MVIIQWKEIFFKVKTKFLFSEKEDCFICVDLFKKQTLKSSVILGDAVFQVSFICLGTRNKI